MKTGKEVLLDEKELGKAKIIREVKHAEDKLLMLEGAKIRKIFLYESGAEQSML